MTTTAARALRYAALGVAVCGAGGWLVFDPSAPTVVRAVRELGPISGWRCARSVSYGYDPRRDAADRTLLADAPEQFLRASAPDRQSVWVEADLRSGETLVWTQAIASPETPRRVYVLSPGRLQSIGIDAEAGWSLICASHLADWHIVAEHALE